MKLHEYMEVDTMRIKRVPGGGLYWKFKCPMVFVPYHGEFDDRKKLSSLDSLLEIPIED